MVRSKTRTSSGNIQEEVQLAFPADPVNLAEWVSENPAKAQAALHQYYQVRVRVARDEVNEFIELVGRDERTGKPLVQAPIHESFQSLANKHKRLILWAHIESGKSSQISVLRSLWKLGNDSRRRIAIVSNTQRQSSKLVRSMMGYLERSSALREVFPKLKPGSKWTDTAFTVERPTTAKDYSVQALGVHGAVVGARIDDLILDDILDFENTRTPDQRQQTFEWIQASLLGRLTEDATVSVVGTAWHPDDIMHRFARLPGWAAYRFPVLSDDGSPRWPERWSLDRIAEFEASLGPTEANRQLHCRARDDNEARFKRDWIERCLIRGDGRTLPEALYQIPRGYRVFTGVDLGTSDKKTSDLTVLFTICVHPDESREVLCVESGRWNAPEIVQRILSTHKRYLSIIVVESNAAQDYLRQFITKDSGIPILPFNTGKNKFNPEFGIESLAVEMFNEKWIIPSVANVAASPEIAAWIEEMLFYNPIAHTGDRLMASWFAREGFRLHSNRPKAQRGHVDLTSR